MTIVNTVLGPVSASELGKTLIHEHFIFGYPGFAGDVTLGRVNREEALRVGIDVAERVKAHGVKTVLDPTPNECGRDPLLLKQISEQTGVQIICTTGYYYEGEGATAYFKMRFSITDGEKEIYEMFMKEITEGIGDTGIKAGAIKLASSKNAITDYERTFFKAAARAQQQTGVPIITHTQEGTMGPQQAELLVSAGADPKRVLIGHMCGNTDVVYHMNTLQYGVNIGFDRFGVQGFVGTPTDLARQATLTGLLGLGYGKQIMLSQDTVNFWLGRPVVWPPELAESMANYHPTHLFENIVPSLQKSGITDEQLHQLFVENPKSFFAG